VTLPSSSALYELLKMKLSLVCALLVLGLSHVYCQQAGGQTACQRHRARELGTSGTPTTTGALVPECEENGDYKPMQCHGMSTNGRRFCQCWTPTGDIVTSPSRNTNACECHLARHKATQGTPRPLVGAFVPKCGANGSFRSKQCHSSTGHCWCVNPAGVKQGESVRDPNLTCN